MGGAEVTLEGRVAIVTGVTKPKGAGRAIAQRLAEKGAAVAITGREKSLPGAEAIAEEFRSAGHQAQAVAADSTDSQQIEAAVAQVVDSFGGLDILVNNAGIAGVNKMLWECTPEEWRDVMDIDLYGVFLCCRAFVPGMLEAGWGRIVNVASIAGKEGNPTASHYSAAKAGVIGLTKSLGKELSDTNVRVNCITPAVIETEILKQCTQAHIDYMLSKIPMGRVGQAGEVAAMIAWLSSDEVSFSTGAVFDISGGRATY